MNLNAANVVAAIALIAALLAVLIAANKSQTPPPYNEVCHQVMVNSDTQTYQTFYWPCTNNASIVVAPGN